MDEFLVTRFALFFDSASQLDDWLVVSTAKLLFVVLYLRLFFTCSTAYQTSTQVEPEVVDFSLLLQFSKRLFLFRRRSQWLNHVWLTWVTGFWAFINRGRIIFSCGWLAACATWLRKEKV